MVRITPLVNGCFPCAPSCLPPYFVLRRAAWRLQECWFSLQTHLRLGSWVQQAALAARSCLYLLVAFPYLGLAPDAKSWLSSRTPAASAMNVARAPAWTWPLSWWERTTRPSFSSSEALGIHTLGAMSCMIITMPSSISLLLPSSCYTCPYWIFKLKK